MALLKRNKLMLAAGLSAALLGGCADYSNNWDSVTLRAGNASQANTAIQAIKPWPPEADNTVIQYGG